MTISYVIKGGSRQLDESTVSDQATLQLHAVTCDQATVQDSAVVARSTIQDQAVIGGTAHIKDAVVGGETYLTVESIGKHGHIMNNDHVVHLIIRGRAYTVHRTHSEAKGFSAQVIDSAHRKVTEVKLRQMVVDHPEYRILQFTLNMQKKAYQDEEGE